MPRESECTQEHVDKAWRYINGGYREEGQMVPTSEGLAIYLDVCRQTPYNWRTQVSCQFNDEFTKIVDRLQAVQVVGALNGGLSGEMNAAIVKTVIGAHGYTDKQSLEHSGPGGGAVKTESKVEWVIQPIRPLNEADSEA